MEYKGKHWISVVAMFGIPNILSALWSYIFLSLFIGFYDAEEGWGYSTCICRICKTNLKNSILHRKFTFYNFFVVHHTLVGYGPRLRQTLDVQAFRFRVISFWKFQDLLQPEVQSNCDPFLMLGYLKEISHQRPHIRRNWPCLVKWIIQN